MSLTYSALVSFQKVAKLLNSKSFQYYAMFCLSFFLVIGVFLGSYSVSAEGQGGFTYRPQDGFKEQEEVTAISVEVEGMNKVQDDGSSWVSSAILLADTIWPQGNVNHSAMVANPNISPGAKLGLIGGIDIPVSAMLYNPPSIDIPSHLAQEWVPNYDHSAGIYAESGYQMLMATPIVSELWSVTRNIAYMLFVIVFIVAGFMIMFRHKLGGQTMVSVYNTLPNIIVGLILVTFSFAIVGLLINVGAIFIRVISGEMNLSTTVDAVHPFGVMSTYAKDIVGHYVIEAFTKNVMTLLAGVLFFAFGWMVGLLIMILVVGAIAFASIKIFFTLIKAYVGIIFDTIAAPIVFAIATIPGRQPMMKDWFNRVMKNVMVFVLVFFLINLPLYLMEQQAEFTLFGGDLQGATGMTAGQGIGSIVMAGMSIYFLFLAGNVPKLLEDYFPQTGGRGAAEAAKGTKDNMAKIPLVGGFFKG